MEKQHNSPTWQCFQGYLPQSQRGHDNLSQYRGVIYGFIPSSSPLLFHDILTIFQLSSHHYQHYCWWNHHETTINELITIKSHEILINHHQSTMKNHHGSPIFFKQLPAQTGAVWRVHFWVLVAEPDAKSSLRTTGVMPSSSPCSWTEPWLDE